MRLLPIFIFVATCLGVAVGRVPWLTLDRTGIALLGAIAMVASGALPLDFALGAIDHGTILLLFALMIVSAQLRLGGFYTRVALYSAGLLDRPYLFLAASMLLSAVPSALLANDIVCLAFAPVIAVSVVRAGLNPAPFLLGLALASNIGSAATLIGNPQNMLIGQVGRLAFAPFFLWCLPPTLASLGIAFVLFCALFIVIEGVSLQGVPEWIVAKMAAGGISLHHPPVLAGVAAVLSNLVSNVPAVMLLVRFLDPSMPVQWYTLAAASTFAGNLILIGSIANLIVVEQARHCGVEIGLGEHARVGIPATLASLAVLWGWIEWAG